MTRTIRISLFCSAREVVEPAILEPAAEFARALAERKWELLYGGGRAGLMGYFADQVLAAGGVVRGAITEDLAAGAEGLHPGLQESVIVKDLFERKKWLMEKADGFVIFPGGFGTLDEALEVITWKALGCHDKPVVFVNTNGFWHDQLSVFKRMSEQGMIPPESLKLYTACDSIAATMRVFEDAFLKGTIRE